MCCPLGSQNGSNSYSYVVFVVAFTSIILLWLFRYELPSWAAKASDLFRTSFWPMLVLCICLQHKYILKGQKADRITSLKPLAIMDSLCNGTSWPQTTATCINMPFSAGGVEVTGVHRIRLLQKDKGSRLSKMATGHVTNKELSALLFWNKT